MKKFSTKAIRIIELAQVMDSIQPKDLANTKDIRLNVGLVNDLNEVNKQLATKVADLNVKRDDVLKPYRAEYVAKSQGLSEEEAKALSLELDKRVQVEQVEALKQFAESQKEIDAMSQTELEVELSDEKHAKLSEWLVKFGMEKYTDKKVYVEMLDLLEVKE